MKAEEIERIKDILPTSLGSEEIRRTLAKDILRRSIYSARMANATYLKKVQEVCQQISAGTINQARAREVLLDQLSQMGHSPTDKGGLQNPASIRRLNLILDTQRQMAASVARMASETPDTLEAYPAYELRRADTPRQPREDWPARWRAAGDSFNWDGAAKNQYIALKSSPIWQALGDGVGGFNDTLGNNYPPFAYSSYMDWFDVDRDTAIQLGLIAREAPAESHALAVPSLSPDDAELLEATEKFGFGDIFADLLAG